MAWINDLQMAKTFLNRSFILELINRSLINKMNLQPLIFYNGHLHVSLANNDLILQTEYIKIWANVKGVEAIISAWLVDEKVYNLLLNIAWMKRVQLS